MTKITQVYNAITDLLQANLPGYTRLSNPYAPEVNAFPILRNGYGLAVGPGEDTQRTTGCVVSWRRQFTVILLNQIYSTENDVDRKELIEQELLEKHNIIRKQIYLDSTLGGIAYLTIVPSDQGISFISAGDLLFLGLEMNLETEYTEDLNILP